MKRIAALAATLLLSQSASALTIEPWEHQNSLALGDTTVVPTRFRLLDDNGAPAAGVAYAYIIDDSCAIFPNGATGANGITDDLGFAPAAPVTARGLTPACEMIFGVNGVESVVRTHTFVFSPDDVVLVATPAAVDWFTNRSFQMSIEAQVGGVVVNAFPMAANATVGTNGATATITSFLGALNSGASLGFVTNEKQGRYEIVVTYRSKALSIPVEQRKKL